MFSYDFESFKYFKEVGRNLINEKKLNAHLEYFVEPSQ